MLTLKEIPARTLPLLCLFSMTVFGWTIDADFEDGTVGAKSKGTQAFSGAFEYSLYSSKYVHSGKLSSEVGIDGGTTGFGKWGGSFNYPDLYEGDEIWFRTYLYFPSDFDFQAGGVGLKTMRIHTATADSKNEGYLDVLISGDLTVGSEVTSEYFTNNPDWKNKGSTVPKGTWHTLEQYVKFSSVPGQAIYRVWQNGKLVSQDVTTKTMRSPTSKSDFIYLFTYWNDNAPKTQKAYVDDIFITNEKPSNQDSYGNAMIGLKGQAAQMSFSIRPAQFRSVNPNQGQTFDVAGRIVSVGNVPANNASRVSFTARSGAWIAGGIVR